jgi:uncharacterized protein with ParB-like and HNH nuclease domain
MTTFDSTKESLLDLLQSIKQGKTQLPDFQRGWVWDDHHIRDLPASISLSFPIGAVMMLQTGNPDVRFKPRLSARARPSINRYTLTTRSISITSSHRSGAARMVSRPSVATAS